MAGRRCAGALSSRPPAPAEPGPGHVKPVAAVLAAPDALLATRATRPAGQPPWLLLVPARHDHQHRRAARCGRQPGVQGVCLAGRQSASLTPSCPGSPARPGDQGCDRCLIVLPNPPALRQRSAGRAPRLPRSADAGVREDRIGSTAVPTGRRTAYFLARPQHPRNAPGGGTAGRQDAAPAAFRRASGGLQVHGGYTRGPPQVHGRRSATAGLAALRGGPEDPASPAITRTSAATGWRRWSVRPARQTPSPT